MTEQEEQGEQSPALSREARIRQWAASPTPRPDRVTTEQVLARMDERRDRVRQARQAQPPERRAARARMVLAGLLVVAAGAVMFWDSAQQSDHGRMLAQIQSERAELTASDIQAREQARAAQIDPKQAEKDMIAAKAAADQVAQLQNQYHGTRLRTAVVNGRPQVVGADEVKKIKAELKQKFEPEAVSGSDFDPSAQWYTMWNKKKDGSWEPAPGDAYLWTAQRVWTVRDAATTDVIWLLTEKSTGDVLGWAVGQFHPATGKIDHVVQAVTSQGQAKVAPTDETGNSGHGGSAQDPQKQEGGADE